MNADNEKEKCLLSRMTSAEIARVVRMATQETFSKLHVSYHLN